jgi:hypothetical protein
VKKLLGKGKDKIQAALERLDRLTKDEGLSAVAQTLGVVHGIADDMRVVMRGAPYFRDSSQMFIWIPVPLDGKAPTSGIGQNSGMWLAQNRYHPNWLDGVVALHQASNEMNMMKRLLFPAPFVAETDGIL